jgi:hypothetical protein
MEYLLFHSSHTIIVDFFGSVPRGFLSFLSRLGDCAFSQDFYQFWHKFLVHKPDQYRHLLNAYLPPSELKTIVEQLPEELQLIKVAQRLGDADTAEKFVCALVWLHDGKAENVDWMDVREKLDRGVAPRKLLDEKLLDAPFPAPFIKNHAQFRHLNTPREMRRAAREFQNCLGMEFSLCSAQEGTTEFYEWIGGETNCIVSIIADHPFGFRLGEIKTAENAEPTPNVSSAIVFALDELGIVERESVVDMVAGVRRMISR